MPLSREKPNSGQVWAMSICFLLLFFTLNGLTIYLWTGLERIEYAILHVGPVPAQPADPGTQKPQAVPIKVVPDSSALVIVLLVGGLGGLLHSMRSFYFHLSKGDLLLRRFPKYLSRPITGAILAAIFFLAFRAGLADSDVKASDSGLILYAAMAGLVGMFSDQAVAKLKKIAEAIFSVPEREEDTDGAEPESNGEEPEDETGENADGELEDEGEASPDTIENEEIVQEGNRI